MTGNLSTTEIIMHFSLFTPLELGGVPLRNRIALPPLTRCRSAQPGNIPNDMMRDYYVQRASAGFMVTEGTQIEPRGQGYAWTPGIHSAEQIAGWQNVTQAVRAQGGTLFCQLWHVGRVSHRALQPQQQPPIAPSALPATNVRVFIETGPGEGELVAPSEPRALETEEIPQLVELYRQAAVNAKQAGFDGIELHAANGYLINQFISEHTNDRTDQYGGSLTNRLRFLKEVVAAVSTVFDSGRIGVRFSPLFSTTEEDRVYLGLVEPDPAETYLTAAKMLDEMNIGYLSIAEADWDNSPQLPESFRIALRKTFTSVIMVAGRYDQAKAQYVLAQGWADLVGFGRTFIANPDLPERLQRGVALNSVELSSLYGGTAKGYTDYPTIDD
ncbi:alkene reductase [Rosenbergiella epipactidis]|uniref:alkene reductase n=1 Tax=Rosenbergiella epipactidis TaxID=1544694 RepID=UPI00066450BE|nr:alkene reductase [Rosenbergiella epipactidis]KYP93422.1 oxidoreductase [bacteria symbiont BFo2 of Frankliniella occidentalis]KYP94693.1 oxidoreductase [bacteria symbiont BFo2 of Frankliniella occidentalis]